jgi:hypothetical protein
MWLKTLPRHQRRNWIPKEWWILCEIWNFQRNWMQQRPHECSTMSVCNLWYFGECYFSIIRDWWWWMMQLFSRLFNWFPGTSFLVQENISRGKRDRFRHSFIILRATMLQMLENLEFLQALNVLTTKQGLQ